MADETEGSVPTETPEDTSPGEPEGETTPEKETPEDSFVSEKDIMEKIRANPDLDHVFKKMQGTYTKKMQGISTLRDKAEAVDRFWSDPEYARQVLQQRTSQLGLSPTQAPSQAAGGDGSPVTRAPSELVDAVKRNLSPELQWMAETIANAHWAAHQVTARPVEERRQNEQMAQRLDQYEEMAAALSEKAPGWEDHEDEMEELLNFLESDKMHHKRFGSKLDILYAIVTGNATAIAEASRRMSGAARSRTPASSGGAGRTSGPNTEERIKKAKTPQEQWDIAGQAAIEELKAHGIEIR